MNKYPDDPVGYLNAAHHEAIRLDLEVRIGDRLAIYALRVIEIIASAASRVLARAAHRHYVTVPCCTCPERRAFPVTNVKGARPGPANGVGYYCLTCIRKEDHVES